MAPSPPKTLLENQELVGTTLGRGWLLQNLPRWRSLRREQIRNHQYYRTASNNNHLHDYFKQYHDYFNAHYYWDHDWNSWKWYRITLLLSFLTLPSLISHVQLSNKFSDKLNSKKVIDFSVFRRCKRFKRKDPWWPIGGILRLPDAGRLCQRRLVTRHSARLLTHPPTKEWVVLPFTKYKPNFSKVELINICWINETGILQRNSLRLCLCNFSCSTWSAIVSTSCLFLCLVVLYGGWTSSPMNLALC